MEYFLISLRKNNMQPQDVIEDNYYTFANWTRTDELRSDYEDMLQCLMCRDIDFSNYEESTKVRYARAYIDGGLLTKDNYMEIIALWNEMGTEFVDLHFDINIKGDIINKLFNSGRLLFTTWRLSIYCDSNLLSDEIIDAIGRRDLGANSLKLAYDVKITTKTYERIYNKIGCTHCLFSSHSRSPEPKEFFGPKSMGGLNMEGEGNFNELETELYFEVLDVVNFNPKHLNKLYEMMEMFDKTFDDLPDNVKKVIKSNKTKSADK